MSQPVAVIATGINNEAHVTRIEVGRFLRRRTSGRHSGSALLLSTISAAV
mgnify:FL=1